MSEVDDLVEPREDAKASLDELLWPCLVVFIAHWVVLDSLVLSRSAGKRSGAI